MTTTVKVLVPAKIAENAQTGCWEWKGFKSRDGYGIVHRGNKLIKAHRLAYCEANDKSLNDISGVVIRHSCDNRKCVNPSHLLCGTNADNTQDRKERGRCARGSRDGNAKLNEEQVSQIKKRYIPYSRTDGAIPIAKEYGVSKSLIRQIGLGIIWKHVDKQVQP